MAAATTHTTTFDPADFGTYIVDARAAKVEKTKAKLGDVGGQLVNLANNDDTDLDELCSFLDGILPAFKSGSAILRAGGSATDALKGTPLMLGAGSGTSTPTPGAIDPSLVGNAFASFAAECGLGDPEVAIRILRDMFAPVKGLVGRGRAADAEKMTKAMAVVARMEAKDVEDDGTLGVFAQLTTTKTDLTSAKSELTTTKTDLTTAKDTATKAGDKLAKAKDAFDKIAVEVNNSGKVKGDKIEKVEITKATLEELKAAVS